MKPTQSPTALHDRDLRRVSASVGCEQRAAVIEGLLRHNGSDPEWVSGFLIALGPESLGEALAAFDPFPRDRLGIASGQDTARAIYLLAEAATWFDALRTARLITTVGVEVLASTVEVGLLRAGDPFTIGAERFGLQLAAFAGGLGRLSAERGVEEPTLQGLLEALSEGSFHELANAGQPRTELAAWLVARSRCPALQTWFIESLLDVYSPRAPRAVVTARSAAVVMAALEPASALRACLARLEAERQSSFFADSVRLGDGCLVGLPLGSTHFGIEREIRRDLTHFLCKVTRLEPSLVGASEGTSTRSGGAPADQPATCGRPRPGAPGS